MGKMKTARKSTLGLRLSLIAGAVLAIGLAIFVTDRLLDGTGAGPTIGGPFALVDQNGEAVTDKTYRGKWLLIYFGYTHCPDACPLALSNVAEALEQLGPKKAKVQPIFVTIDPQRDTPALLKGYVGAFDAGIVGLGGSEAAIAAAAKAYRVYYAPHRTEGSADYTMDHSSILYVMNPDGRFVTNFTHDSSPERIATRLADLIK